MAERKNSPLELGCILDRLIERYAAVLERQDDDTIKIGDFLKVIEVRSKLQPDNTTQAAFWSHLEEIRNDALGDAKGRSLAKPKPTRPKQGAKRPGKTVKNGDKRDE